VKVCRPPRGTAILFPVFAQAREQARLSACQSNCKQYSTAWMMYVQDYDSPFPPFSVAAAFKPGELNFTTWDLLLHLRRTRARV
jgi:hypothetical protein